jgi:hypothetical protein
MMDEFFLKLKLICIAAEGIAYVKFIDECEEAHFLCRLTSRHIC